MGMLLSCCWVFSVLASRVYLGVASLASVSGGAIIAVGTAGVWGLVREALADDWPFAVFTVRVMGSVACVVTVRG
jgi:membrane-associated phospholipid phosphatase